MQVQLALFTNGNTGSVEIATSLAGAETIIEKKNTHIIISDIKLTEGNTLALIKKTKTVLPDIFIIVLTNHFDDYHKRYALEAGADYFIDKALAFQEIPKALASLTGRD